MKCQTFDKIQGAAEPFIHTIGHHPPKLETVWITLRKNSGSSYCVLRGVQSGAFGSALLGTQRRENSPFGARLAASIAKRQGPATGHGMALVWQTQHIHTLQHCFKPHAAIP